MNISSAGLDALINSFNDLDRKLPEFEKRAMYKAAGLIADELKREIDALPIQENPDGSRPWAEKGEQLTGITTAQKADLEAGMGIAKFREEGGIISTSIGFSGKGSTKTKHGRMANSTLMRQIESGTSYRKKNPVVRRTAAKVRAQAKAALQKEVTQSIQKEI